MERKTFTYYDSLKGENPGCIQAMRFVHFAKKIILLCNKTLIDNGISVLDFSDYICAESLDKKKTNLDLTGWRNDSPKVNLLTLL